MKSQESLLGRKDLELKAKSRNTIKKKNEAFPNLQVYQTNSVHYYVPYKVKNHSLEVITRLKFVWECFNKIWMIYLLILAGN